MNSSFSLLGAGFVLVSASLSVNVASAQEREVRELSGFTGVAVGGGIDVQVAIGNEFRVEIEADDTERLVTEIDGDTLRIDFERGGLFGSWFSWGGGADVYITLPELRSISVSGGSDVESVGTVTGESLEIRASGGSDLAFAVQVDELEVRTSGGSDVGLIGSAGTVNVRSSGGSDFDARDLIAANVELRSSGGADVSISVSDRLVARASGGSDITYLGEPSEVDIDSSGGADIRHR